MDLLKKGHQASHKETNIVVVGGPQNNQVEFFLEVTNLHNCLGLAEVEHLLRQNQSTVDLIARDLINEREYVQNLCLWARKDL